jgi:hypothetical protein
MPNVFAKFASWLAIGAGTVLSLTGAGAAVGAPLIAAGTAGLNEIGSSGVDSVSSTVNKLIESLQKSGGAANAAKQSGFVNTITIWIQNNFLLIIAIIGAILIFKPFKHKRRK